MPRGVNSKKREREYKELVNKLKKNDRYEGREKEVASRIVNKQRAKSGETKAKKSDTKTGSKQQQLKKEAMDKNLPIKNYPELTAKQIDKKLNNLSESDLKKVKKFEAKHKSRKTVMSKIEQQLKNAA